jgi:hypothetical protein
MDVPSPSRPAWRPGIRTTWEPARNQERVTFLIEAQDRENVLLPVAALFDELNVRIEAIWMVRHKRTGNPHLTVTVETGNEGARQIVEYLLKVAGVLSAKTQTGAKALIPSSPCDAE